MPRRRLTREGKIAVLGVLAIIGFIVGLVMFANAEQRKKCESLRAQGVKAYVAEAFMEAECIVVHRAIQTDED